MAWWQLALCAYAFTSFVLWKYPHFLFTQKRLKIYHKAKKWAIAHRGGSAEQPENTLEAFKHAMDLGCDMLEMDVQCTRDGHLVISHDNNLLRLCGVNQLISELNYDQLPQYLKTFNSHFLTTSCRFKDKEYRLVKLEDVFKTFPGVPMCIDIKVPTDYTISTAISQIRAYARQQITVLPTQFLGSNNESTQRLIKRLYPEGLTFMSAKRVLFMYACYFLGLIGLFPIYEDIVCLPIMTPDFRRLKRAEMGKVRGMILYEISSDKFVSGLTWVSKPLNSHLRRRGMKVFYWVLNDYPGYQYATSLDCDGIMTDKPTLLLQYYRDAELSST